MPNEAQGEVDLLPLLPGDTRALKNRRLHLLILIVAAGTTASLIYHLLTTTVLGWDHVSVSFLLGTGGRLDYLGNTFMDLTSPLEDARASVTDGAVWLSPTPLLHVVYVLLLPLGRTAALLLQAGVFLAGITLLLWRTYVDALGSRAERVICVVLLLALSYPVLFVLERGNIEMLLFLVMAGFLYSYYWKRSVWCVVLLGIAISLKMYPAVFLVLLLADRRYKWTIYAVLCAGTVTLGSILFLALFLKGSLVDYLRISVDALRQIDTVYVEGFWGLPYGHSLWGLLVSLVGAAGFDQAAFAARAGTTYTIAVLVAFALLTLFVIRVVSLPWQRVTLLTVAALAFPTVSADYRLLYAYLPLAMLLNSPVRTRVDTVCLVLLGCLLVPMDYFYGGILHSEGWPADRTSSSVIVYAVVLLALLVVVAWDAASAKGRSTTGEAELLYGTDVGGLDGTEAQVR